MGLYKEDQKIRKSQEEKKKKKGQSRKFYLTILLEC